MIDLDKLNNLLGNDKQIVGRFLDLYIEKAPQLAEKLCNQLLHNDYVGASITAHELKSQSAYLGLSDIVQAAALIEEATDTGATEHLDVTCRQLRLYLDKALVEIKKIA
jgi:HPt (histidine-containing phosphotransfer) domain-containing protein